MRNKKFRGWFLILILVVFAAVSFVAFPFVESLEEKIMLISCGSLFIIGVLLLLPLYLEIKDDRIITRLGVTSLNKEYRGSYKKHVFMFDDLRDLYIEDNKTVHLVFKGGESATFSIVSYASLAVLSTILQICCIETSCVIKYNFYGKLA